VAITVAKALKRVSNAQPYHRYLISKNYFPEKTP
jgi:hypothetical protein